MKKQKTNHLCDEICTVDTKATNQRSLPRPGTTHACSLRGSAMTRGASMYKRERLSALLPLTRSLSADRLRF